MKLKKIIAAVAAAAVAVAAMAISASAVDVSKYIKSDDTSNNMIFILADKEGDPNWCADTGNTAEMVYGATYYLTLNEKDVSSKQWIGGKIGINATKAGWKELKTWGNGKEDIVIEADKTQVTVTYKSDAALFTSEDAYAMFWLQSYGKPITVVGVDFLDADGKVIGDAYTFPVIEAAPAEEVKADDAAPAEEVKADDEVAAEEVADEAADEEIATDDADEEIAADEAAPAEEAPVADETTTAAATGNTAAAVVVSVMALAAAAAVVAKRK